MEQKLLFVLLVSAAVAMAALITMIWERKMNDFYRQVMSELRGDMDKSLG